MVPSLPYKSLYYIGILLCCSSCIAQKSNFQKSWKFDFGNTKTAAGYTAVEPSAVYSTANGFGFEKPNGLQPVVRTGKHAVHDDFITAEDPFLFSVQLPEGNYNVKVILGDRDGTADATIRAESRRLMVERSVTKSGERKEVLFTVHIRDTLIRTTGRMVRIKPREKTNLHWDDKLTLEFNGPQPKIAAIEIIPAGKEVMTVFLAGNSTVVDQSNEPYAAWGQMMPHFFQPGKVAIGNYAESGESLSSFIAARRFEKMLSLMQKGDYAFVEFGHNDQKQKGEGVGAFTTYKRDLKHFITEVKKKGGIPVLVTSMQRRSFDSATGKIIPTLGDYPEAVRQTAKEEGVALIDLNNMSKTMYEAWGLEDSKKAFVIYPAHTFPGQETALNDNTHFNPYGAYRIAQCIINGIKDNKLGISQYLKKDVKHFDPAKPDETTALYWPLSPARDTAKPDGN